jgi:predicted  nucleic acid-binding Zn-ribbon protein
MSEQIRALEDLARMDAQLKALNDALVEERTRLQTLEKNLAELDAKLEREQAGLKATERARGDAQQEARTMCVQLDHSRDKLNRSRTEREQQAAQREVEELRKLIRDKDDDVQKLGVEAEAVREQIVATEAQARTVRAELDACRGDIEAKVKTLEADHSSTSGGRGALVKALPANLYRKYDALRAKKGTGVTTTTDGTCRACNMALPPQLFHRLSREPSIEQCPSCQRLIHFVAAQPAPED